MTRKHFLLGGGGAIAGGVMSGWFGAQDAFTTAEGSADAFIDVVDGFLTVSPRSPEDVPFWHAVYGGYATYFGTPENHEDDDDTFWALQARETLWGQSLGWYHTLLMGHPAKVAIVNRLLAFRQANLDCLAYGELLGEVQVKGNVPSREVLLLGRKSFADWADPKAELSPPRRGSLPGVLGYVYRSGTTGRVALFVANLMPEEQEVALNWGGVTRDVRFAAHELSRIDL